MKGCLIFYLIPLHFPFRQAFSEFEASVGHDSSKAMTMDGTVHPLCAHTLSYMRRIFTFPNVGVGEAIGGCRVTSRATG